MGIRARFSYKGGAKDARDQKRADAEERQAGRNTLSPQQQLEVLDRRLGAGVGAVKERLRLRTIIDERKNQEAKQKKDAAVSSDGAPKKKFKKGKKQ